MIADAATLSAQSTGTDEAGTLAALTPVNAPATRRLDLADSGQGPLHMPINATLAKRRR